MTYLPNTPGFHSYYVPGEIKSSLLFDPKAFTAYKESACRAVQEFLTKKGYKICHVQFKGYAPDMKVQKFEVQICVEPK